jgi:divalent metal cation (Fe/Co/Zn/Cd) transporter
MVIVIAFIAFFQQAEVDSSPLGIAVTCAALILMPVLARLKRNEANRNGNQALRADAVQSATCAYLAALTLGGLLARMLFDIDRIDSVVALGAVPILLVEARRARQGHVCSHC